MEIERFVEEKRRQLNKLTDNIVASDLILLNHNLERLQKISELLSIQKYRLVFIGNPGSGKTTTICNYLNLLDDDLIGKPFTNIELFNVGTGRTTAFEVHYCAGNQTMFKLYPMGMDEQAALIREYCEYEWGEAFPDSTEAASGMSLESSREHDRIIRNMLGFKSSKELSERLKRDYSQKNFEAFLEKMLQTAALTSRTRRTVSYDGSISVKQWIKKTFSDINNGRISDISIPCRVDVFLNPKDIQINLPGNISEVIDTRGFEGNEREDLKKYLKADDTISIIIDQPKEVPGANQKKVLGDWILPEERDIIPRLSLFVKVRDDDLEKVNEADGDPERGEEIKRDEISRTVQTDRLNYHVNNTLFLDSYDGIFTEKRRVPIPAKDKTAKPQMKWRTYITACDEGIRSDSRERITDHINAIISEFHGILEREAAEIKLKTENLLEEISVPSLSKQYADFLKKAVHSLEALRIGLIGSEDDDGKIYTSFENFTFDFCRHFRYVSKIRWNSARKTAFMAGTWDNAQLYDELSGFTFLVSKNLLESEKNQMIHFLREGDFKDLHSFMNSCQRKVDQDYIALLNQIKTNAHHLMVDAFTVKSSDLNYDDDTSIWINCDSACWKRIQDTPGGSGYYDRLMEAFRRRMDRKRVADDIMNMVMDEVDSFFSGILDVLNKKISAL